MAVGVWAVFDFVEAAGPSELVAVDAAVQRAAQRMAGRAGVAGWDPWSALVTRRGVTLEWRELPGETNGLACWKPGDVGRGAIVLDPRPRSQKARAETLTHELIHLERAWAGECPRWPWTIEDRAAEEAEVWTLTDRRMRSWIGAEPVATAAA